MQTYTIFVLILFTATGPWRSHLLSNTSNTQLAMLSSSKDAGMQYSSESGESTDNAMFTAIPEDAHKMNRTLMQDHTDEIKMKYFSLSQTFEENFLARERSQKVNLKSLYSTAKQLFNLDDYEPSQSSAELLQVILSQQSYMNFEKLKHLIEYRGTNEDKKNAREYSEEHLQYLKQRIFPFHPDLVKTVRVFGSNELPGYIKTMFVLDRDHSFRFMDAEKFKACACKTLGMHHHEMILVQFIAGSVTIVALIPIRYVHPLTHIPLCRDKVLLLKKSYTLRIGLNGQEIITLNRLKLLDDIKFEDGTIVESESISVLPVDVNGTKCMALEYTACYSDEHSADTGYVDYMERFLSGKHCNLPALKGVYYHPESDDSNHHYPVVVVESLKSLKDVFIENEVDQVSVLSDVVSSVASFGSDYMKCKVVPDAIFVEDSSRDIQARFCPMYGHSYVSAQSKALVPHTRVPLSELQWMDELVIFLHFKGNVPDKSELPEKHVLKKMFDQRWLSKDERFRPQSLQVLSEELHQLLGKIHVYYIQMCYILFVLLF